MIKRRSVNVDKKATILTLYKRLNRGKVQYSCILWNSDHKIIVNKIERQRRKFLKFFHFKFKKHYNGENYKNLCKALHLPALKSSDNS